MSLRDWGQTLLALLFPERCPFCDAISVGGGPCESCASPDHGESCARDLPEPGNVPCFSPFRYDGEIREAILRFKFRGRRDYASWFGGKIAKELLRRDLSRNFRGYEKIESHQTRRPKTGIGRGIIVSVIILSIGVSFHLFCPIFKISI